MKYINTFREGMHVSDVYLCKTKQIALTKAGKEYGSLILQDKTGTVDAKIWDLSSPGVGSFEALDYVYVDADVTVFQGSHQLNVKRIRRAEDVEYIPSDYLPVSGKNIDRMYGELEEYIRSLKNKYLRDLAAGFFVEDQRFIKEFKAHSAAKSVHHGFVGGLLEHTLRVVKVCAFYKVHGRGPADRPHRHRCPDGGLPHREDAGLPPEAGGGADPLHFGPPRRAGVRFPQETGPSGGPGPEFCRQHGRQTGDHAGGPERSWRQ